jgi:predicted nucleic acid-binding protein
VITLDTSGLLAALNARDRYHREVSALLRAEPAPRFLPMVVLGEISYFMERRLSPIALPALLLDISIGMYTLDCGDGDIQRIDQLVARYADFPLGLVDAAVVACAERRGGRVLTTDFRHFGAVAREGRIALAIPQRG